VAEPDVASHGDVLHAFIMEAQLPAELPSKEEEDRVELVDWDDNDDFIATSPTTSHASGGVMLAGLGAGSWVRCAPSRASLTPGSGGSSAVTLAATSIPPSPAQVLVAANHGDAVALARLKSTVVCPVVTSPTRKQGGSG
jgi:hypothetical protein